MLIRSVIVILLLAKLPLNVNLMAQEMDTTWTRTYGEEEFDYSSSIIIDSTDNCYLICGASTVNENTDVYLLKVDENGDTAWTNRYGGPGFDVGLSVSQTPDACYIIAGQTNSYGEGAIDIYLLKVNNIGDTIWTNSFGGLLADLTYSVQATEDGGCIVAGHTASFSDNIDIWILRVDSNGDTLWTRRYGGEGNEEAYCMQPVSDDRYIIAGHTTSFGAGSSDIYLLMLNAEGDTIWTKTYGTDQQEYSKYVHPLYDGGFLILGGRRTSDYPLADVLVIRINENGDTLWTGLYGGEYDEDQGYSAIPLEDEGFLLVGQSSPLGYDHMELNLLRLDNNGDSLWSRLYGGPEYDGARSIVMGNNGNYLVCGYSLSFGAGNGDVWLLSFDAETGISIEIDNIKPTNLYFSQSYPNPFNASTTISYSLPEQSDVRIEIYNILGEKVAVLFEGSRKAGHHTVTWQAINNPSGVYFARLQARGHSDNVKMVLLK
jgi:hypothetical protein